jgi:alkylation response protein AidB-like acyl-CoA dehydrogenase
MPSNPSAHTGQGVRTTAEKDSNGDYILNGSKTYITNGAKADYIIVVAKTVRLLSTVWGTGCVYRRVETGLCTLHM